MEEKRRLGTDQRGVTLVELLAAIVILSIVAVVLYRGFIIGAQTNARARVQHQATSLAQNVLEGLKAENVGEILSQFENPVSVDSEGNVTVHFDILPQPLMPPDLNAKVGAFGPYLSAGETDGYVRTGDGKYYLYLQDVRMENNLYDVMITLDASQYRTDLAASPGAPPGSGQAFNSQEMVQIPQMDATYDAIIADSKVHDKEGYEAVSIKAGAGFNPRELYRTITITVQDTDLLDGNVNSRVTAEYKYFYETDNQYKETDYVFDNIDEPQNALRSLFLFYQPAYDWGKDTIIIDNKSNRDMDLYLIKQQTTANLVELDGKERGYRMSLQVNEQFGGSAAHVRVLTNLDTNLATGQESVVKQAAFMYNGSVLSEEQKKQVLGVNGLSNMQVRDKLMDVVVEVFRAGGGSVPAGTADFLEHTGKKAAELAGSIRN